MTKLLFVNYYLLQWFFIRLTKLVDRDGAAIKWGIMYWVRPLTGWENSYKYVGKCRYLWFQDLLPPRKMIFGCEATGNANNPYLMRYTLFERPWLQACLHIFISSDWTKDFHDHPWPFISIILWRGYLEETPDGKIKRRWPGMILIRKATHRHRVQLIGEKKAITLVFMGRRIRQWFFYGRKSGKWLWSRYFSEKGCS